MTKPKFQLLGPSGPGSLVWTDNEVMASDPVMANWPSVVAELGPHISANGVEPEAILSWLLPRLVDLRISEQARDSMAQRSAVVKWLESAAADAPRAIADGRLRTLPAWHASPAVWHAAAKGGHDWKALLRRGDSATIAQVLRDAAASLRRERSNRGRPSSLERDKLVEDLARRLRQHGMQTQSSANELAAQILVRCRVKLPDDESMPRARRRGRRGSISVLPRA